MEVELYSIRTGWNLFPGSIAFDRRVRLKVKFRFPYGKDVMYVRDMTESIRRNTIAGSLDKNRQAGLGATLWIQQIMPSASNGRMMGCSLPPGLINSIWRRARRTFRMHLLFTPEMREGALPDFEATRQNSQEHWESFWSTGGAIDFQRALTPSTGWKKE